MRTDTLALLTATALLMPYTCSWADGTVYKCRNPQGDLIYQESPCAQNAQPISSWADLSEAKQKESTPEQSTSGMLIIKQHDSGHYFLPGSINGEALMFVIDTGASVVSLPRSVALSAQIYCKDKILMQTANGSTSVCTAIIPKLRFGPFLIKDAPAMIAPNLGQPLLGMNILQQFRVEQENGEMRISLRN